MPAIPRGHSEQHEASGPMESEPIIQSEMRGHSVTDQVQPPDADAQDLYGEAY